VIEIDSKNPKHPEIKTKQKQASKQKAKDQKLYETSMEGRHCSSHAWEFSLTCKSRYTSFSKLRFSLPQKGIMKFISTTCFI
jgi:hypothetical protein